MKVTTAGKVTKGDVIGLSWQGREYLRSQVRVVIPHRRGIAWYHTTNGQAVLLAENVPVVVYDAA